MDDVERLELARQLFAIVTGIAEDAAGAAAEEQAASDAEKAICRANLLIDAGEHITPIARAITAILELF